MTEITPDLWMKSWDPHVKNNLKYPTESLGVLYARAMDKFPDRPACWMLKREITYSELLEMVQRFATFLQQSGVNKGDVVSICLPNCPQYLITHFGTLLAGAVACGLNPLLAERGIAFQLNDSKSKVIITMDIIYEKRLKKILDDLPHLKIVIATNIAEYMGLSKIARFFGRLIGKIPTGKVDQWPEKRVFKFVDIMQNTPVDVKEVIIDVKNDLALLQYTGGTTGIPKGAELTHLNMIAQHTQFTNWCNFEDGKEIALSALPAFHIGGLIVVTQTVWVAGSQILIPNPRDTDHFIKEIIDKKPTILGNVPTFYGMVINNPKSSKIQREILDHITVYISSAAPFPVEMIHKFENSMHAQNKVMELYGMSETSPTTISNPFFGEKRVGKIGLPFPDTLVKIVDIESGLTLGTGQEGEIMVKGPTVTRGYLNNPEETKRTIEDGWIHTGDVGSMDENGYVQIVDRIKDMIIVGGYKVFSVHVEDILIKHPKIEIVAIIGLPDKSGNEVVKAYVQLKEGIEPIEEVKKDIWKFAEENLSKYEKPKLWEFREELPLTIIGKVFKKALREELTTN